METRLPGCAEDTQTLLETLKSPVSLPEPENCSATLESEGTHHLCGGSSFTSSFVYLPLEVLEGSACKHVFIKVQLGVLVCSALQAHAALGHFLGRRHTVSGADLNVRDDCEGPSPLGWGSEG